MQLKQNIQIKQQNSSNPIILSPKLLIEQAKTFINELYQQRQEKFQDIEFRNLVDRAVDQVLNCNAFFELMQNADDFDATETKSNPVCVSITLKGDMITFSHNGLPFSKEDVKGLVRIAYGNKQNNPNATGFMGIGFKSVYAFSDEVQVTSGPFSFSFSKSCFMQRHLNMLDLHPYWYAFPLWDENYSSINPQAVTMKLKVADKQKHQQVCSYFKALTEHPQMLLFFKHVNEMRLEWGSFKHHIKLSRLEQSEFNSINTQKAVIEINDHLEYWQIWSVRYIVNFTSFSREELHPKYRKLEQTSQIELPLQLAIKTDQDGHIVPHNGNNTLYCTLPTREERKLPFLFNAPFYLDLTRDHIHVNSWNNHLFYCAGLLYADVFLHAFQKRCGWHQLTFPTTLPQQFSQQFLAAMKNVLLQEAWVPCHNEILATPEEVYFDQTGIIEWLTERDVPDPLSLIGQSSRKFVALPQKEQSELYNHLCYQLSIKPRIYDFNSLINTIQYHEPFQTWISQNEEQNAQFILFLYQNYFAEQGIFRFNQKFNMLKQTSFLWCQSDQTACLQAPGIHKVFWPFDSALKIIDAVKYTSVLMLKSTQVFQNFNEINKEGAKQLIVWLNELGVCTLDIVVLANYVLGTLQQSIELSMRVNLLHWLLKHYSILRSENRVFPYGKYYAIALPTNQGVQQSNHCYFPQTEINCFVINTLPFAQLIQSDQYNSEEIKAFYQHFGVQTLTYTKVMDLFFDQFNHYSQEQQQIGLLWIAEHQQKISSFDVSSIISPYAKKKQLNLPTVLGKNVDAGKCFYQPQYLSIESVSEYLELPIVQETFISGLKNYSGRILNGLSVAELNHILVVKALFQAIKTRIVQQSAFSLAKNQTMVRNITHWLFDQKLSLFKAFSVTTWSEFFNRVQQQCSVGRDTFLVITVKEELCPANKVYLADKYQPQLSLEQKLTNINYVSIAYARMMDDINAWRELFVGMGVHENLALSKATIEGMSVNDLKFYYDDAFALYAESLYKVNNTFLSRLYLTGTQYVRFAPQLVINLTKESLYQLFWQFIKNHLGAVINLSVMINRQPTHQQNWPTPHYPSYLLWLIWQFPCVRVCASNKLVRPNQVYTNALEELISPFVELGFNSTYYFLAKEDWPSFTEEDCHALGFVTQLTENDCHSIYEIILPLLKNNQLPTDQFLNQCMNFCLYLKSIGNYEILVETITENLQPFVRKATYASNIDESLLQELSLLTDKEQNILLKQAKQIKISDNTVVSASQILSLNDTSSQLLSAWSPSFFNNDRVSSERIKSIGRKGEQTAITILHKHYQNKNSATVKETNTGFCAKYQQKKTNQSVSVTIEWMDKQSEQGLPFDVKRIKNECTDYYEIKSTVKGATEPFYLSKLQWQFMFKHPENYHVLRLSYLESNTPKLQKIMHLFDKVEKLSLGEFSFTKDEKIQIIPNENVFKPFG